MDTHAQKEIRDIACAIFDYVKQVCPISSQAFLDYRLGSISLSQIEIEAIQNGSVSIKNKREKNEFLEKCKLLGIELKND